MNLWNVKDFPQPPLNTYRASTRDIDIYHLSLIIYDGMVFYKNQDFIQAEAGLLSRFIYRMKMKFRHDKTLKGMEKVNKALLQYLNLNLVDALTNLRNLIPEKYEAVTYFPNRNLLEHILIKLQGLGKLMLRIIESCEMSANYMDNKILIGHFWKVAFMTYCLVSRIRRLCKDLLIFTCDFYQKLLPFRCHLKNNGIDIVPVDYDFPKNLEEWLGAEQILRSDFDIKIPDVNNRKNLLAKMHDEEDSDDSNSYTNELSDFSDEKDNEEQNVIEVIKEYNEDNEVEIIDELIGNEPSKPINSYMFDNMGDVGVVIERTSEKKEIINDVPEDGRSFINKIKNIDQLTQFIKKEEKTYCGNVKKSSFKMLDKMQWNMMKKIVFEAIRKAKKNKSKAAEYINEAKEALLVSID